MSELKSKHLWPLVEQFATADTSDPENTVPGWVALAMLDDLRRLQQAVCPKPVPGEVADILRPLVDEVHWARYGSEDDEQRAALVRYWLDSQRPAPGEGEVNQQWVVAADDNEAELLAALQAVKDNEDTQF